MTLDTLIETMPAEVEKAETVDASEFFDKPAGEVVFVYKDVPLKLVFGAGATVRKLRKLYPDWPENFAQVVALMALSHSEPESPYALEAYCKMVQNQNSFARFLMNRWVDMFPHLLNLDTAAEEKKDE